MVRTVHYPNHAFHSFLDLKVYPFADKPMEKLHTSFEKPDENKGKNQNRNPQQKKGGYT
jgi:hypothetical protein